MEKYTALKRMSEHQPNHQICILNQEVADKLKVPHKKALGIFYSSDTCRRLHEERSGLYLLCDLYVADEVILEYQS